MTIPSQQEIPNGLVLGDSWEWDIPADDYPYSDGWRMSYTLIGEGQQFTINADTGDGITDHQIRLTTHGNLVAGFYRWQLHATKTPTRKTINFGAVRIEPNYGAAGLDVDSVKTDNEKILDAIIALLKGDAGNKYANISVDGRYLVKRNLLELEELRRRYELRVQNERDLLDRRAGRKNYGSTLIRFATN